MVEECTRCGHEIEGDPPACPECGSPYWDTAKGEENRSKPPWKSSGFVVEKREKPE